MNIKYLQGTNYNIHDYYNYVDKILDGTIVSCDTIYLACERFKKWFSRDDIYFDEKDVDKTMEAIKATGDTPYVVGSVVAGDKGVILC